MNILDINNSLLTFLHEEPSDREVFQLTKTFGHFDCELERMSKFANKYDKTGELELIYLSCLCRRQIAETIASVEKILQNPEKLKPYQECIALINSSEAKEVRASLIQRLSLIAAAVSRKPLLGDGHEFDLVLDDAIEAIFTNYPKLHFEVYASSEQPVGTLSNTSPSILVCNSLAEMLLRLEGSTDGIYIGYVSNPGTLDGWFGFFIKSNGNMFSYHERIDEEYVGQHRNMRNGRYVEKKAFDLFPYELCEFSDERDYKGYSTKVEMGEERRFLDATNFPVLVRTILAMAIIAGQHAGKRIEGSPVIVNSLLAHNLAQLDNHKEQTTAIVKWEGSPLVKVSQSFEPPRFEIDKLLRGDYNSQFCHTKKGSQEGRGWFYGKNQDMVDAYGAGFKLNNECILASNSSRRLIGDTQTEQEFIGSATRMRLSAYYEARRQLANYIGARMMKDYSDFGGRKGLTEWYFAALKKRMDKIMSYCADAYDKSVASGQSIVRYGSEERQTNGGGGEIFYGCRPPMSIDVDKNELYSYIVLNELVDRNFICPITQTKASIFFKFRFGTYKQVQDFLGIDLPKFCVGWSESPDYNGNSILDVTDPVGNLESPIGSRMGWSKSFNFRFAIGLSKRGLAKIKASKIASPFTTDLKK